MYFSLITPAAGRERDAAHQWAGGPYIEHQWLWQFFPAAKGSPRDFLYRRSDKEGMPKFYVVSKRPPQAQSTAWSIQTQPYAPKLGVGERLHFDLRANPVVAVSNGGKSRRHDVVMQEKTRLLRERGMTRWQDWQSDEKPALYHLVHDACSAWLKSRALRSGFELDDETLSVEAYEQHAEKNGGLKFSTADFSGSLIVTEPAAFSGALCDGIGHAKAFGCGLLLVRRHS